MRTQIVLDTSVLFAGLYSRTGAAFIVLDLIDRAEIGIHLSVPLILEYESVLKREHARLNLSESEIDRAVNALCGKGMHHKIHYLRVPRWLMRAMTYYWSWRWPLAAPQS